MTDTFLFWLIVVCSLVCQLDVENATLNMCEIFTTKRVTAEVEYRGEVEELTVFASTGGGDRHFGVGVSVCVLFDVLQ